MTRVTSLFASLVSIATLGIAALLPQPMLAAASPAPVPSLRVSDRAGGSVDGPGYYDVTLSPGTATTLYALVGNRGHARGSVSLVSVGARTGTYGTISLGLPSHRPKGVGSWVTLSASRVIADPGKSAVVPFVVRVPRHTKPGDYLGALTAFVPAHARHQLGVSLTIQTRVAIGILVHVPGSRHSALVARGVSAQQRTHAVYVVATIRNSGNVLLKGWGHLWVWKQGRSGSVISVPMSFDMTVPHSTFGYPVPLGGRHLAGRYTYSLKVWWQGGATIRKGSFRVR